MTISDATRAMARTKARRPAAPTPAVTAQALPLAEAIARVEPTWVEAVAVVQAVCAQLTAGQAVPALDAIVLASDGRVAFPPPGPADDVMAVVAVGRLLEALLKTGDCPMSVWDASERARRTPAKVGTAPAFGGLLTCLSAAHGREELQRYVEAARRRGGGAARAAWATSAVAGPSPRVALAWALMMAAGAGL